MLLILLGCLAPGMHAAHSLAPGQMEVGLGAQVNYAMASATFHGRDGDHAIADAGFLTPDPWDFAPEFRIGVGGGFEVAVRGLPFAGTTQGKYSVLDERRHRTPLSIAVAAEVAVDPYAEELVAPRGGVLLSSTIPLGETLAIRPAVAAWYGVVGSAYEFDLPAETADDPSVTDPSLTLSYRNTAFAFPVGVELPVKVGDFALTPYVAATLLLPTSRTLVDGDAISATGTVTGFEAPVTGFGWAGVRFSPWFVPARSQP